PGAAVEPARRCPVHAGRPESEAVVTDIAAATKADAQAGSGQAVRTPFGTAVRRFRKHPAALISVVYILLVVLAAIFARPLSGHDPNVVDLLAARQGPSGEHFLGTDPTGRDVFSRLLFAGRVSLGVGIASATLAVILGA